MEYICDIPAGSKLISYGNSIYVLNGEHQLMRIDFSNKCLVAVEAPSIEEIENFKLEF